MGKVKELDELIEFMWKVSEGKAKPGDAELVEGCASMPIRLQGVTWDKRIDNRSAQFVLDLQRELKAFCQQNPDVFGGDVPLLKVAIRQGSGILDPDFWALIKEAIPNMNAKTAAVLITLILSMTGYQAWDRYQTSQDQARTQQVAVQAIQSMRDVAMKEGLDPVKAETPFRKLTRQLADTDQVSVAGGPVLPAKEVKQLVKAPKTRTPEVAAPCDGEYHLEKIDLTKPMPVLELSQGDYYVSAYLEHLTNAAKKDFLKSIDDRIESQQAPLILKVQIDVRYTGKKIKFGSIVGVGSPRPNMDHKKLADLPPNK